MCSKANSHIVQLDKVGRKPMAGFAQVTLHFVLRSPTPLRPPPQGCQCQLSPKIEINILNCYCKYTQKKNKKKRAHKPTPGLHASFGSPSTLQVLVFGRGRYGMRV